MGMCVGTFPMPVCRSIKTDLLIMVMSVLCWLFFAIEICFWMWTLLSVSVDRSYRLSGHRGALIALNGPYRPPRDLRHPTHGTGPHFSPPRAVSPCTGDAVRCLPPAPPQPCPAWPWAPPSQVHSWAAVPAWPWSLPPPHTCLVPYSLSCSLMGMVRRALAGASK